MPDTPVLYSFRRCPYAMRARLALVAAGLSVELREVVLRDKPPQMLQASPKGTVPVLVTPDAVIDESLDIMHWALGQNDPEGWLQMPPEGAAMISDCDGPFKRALDRTKYHTRYDSDPEHERDAAMAFVNRLAPDPWLFGDAPRLADMAILPFLRQFAHVDRARFDADAPALVRAWLDRFLDSAIFASVMPKFPRWQDADPPTLFPERSAP